VTLEVLALLRTRFAQGDLIASEPKQIETEQGDSTDSLQGRGLSRQFGHESANAWLA